MSQNFKLDKDRSVIASAFGYDEDDIAIMEGNRLPPDDYILLYQDSDWCAFVDDTARQERGLVNCFIVLFKPDSLVRGLHAKMLNEWIEKGFVMEDLQFYQSATASLWELHYREQAELPHFRDLIEAMANRPVMVCGMYKPGVTRAEAIKEAHTFVLEQRKRYQLTQRNNSVHVSDSEEAAVIEGHLWLYGKAAPPTIEDL
jgi:nucleoside diphosphate kinase